ncbi:ATP synthase regulation protein NCA2-domain-containing protein [Dipodascopsis uninucleata]
MSSIVDDKIRTLSLALENLASSIIPELFIPRLRLSETPSSSNVLDQKPLSPVASEGAISEVEPLAGLFNQLMIRPGASTPSLYNLRSVLDKYLEISDDAKHAKSQIQDICNTNPDINISQIKQIETDLWNDYIEFPGDGKKQIEWFVVGSAAIVLYGHLLEDLLNQILPMSSDIYYWENLLNDPINVMIYSLQTAPVRMLRMGREVIIDAHRRISTGNHTLHEWIENIRDAFNRKRSQARNLHILTGENQYSYIRSMLSPFSNVYNEIQKNRQRLLQLRDLHSAGLGLLVGESMTFTQETWRQQIQRAADTMEEIVRGVNSNTESVTDFEERIFGITKSESFLTPPYLVASKLLSILNEHLPNHDSTKRSILKSSGKPDMVTRYWPVAFLSLTFGSAILNTLFRKQASIKQWIEDAGSTLVDFWYNWVVDPIKNILSTIRHDDDAEIAIVGRKSLESDMDSLERMVVDFAVDNSKSALDDSQISQIRNGVREGDVSAVLKVYEMELKNPIANTLRGELIRTLLIQVQKTKVDVEVAITGIDRLLKSQELVFGILAILPGLLISYAIGAWFLRTFRGKGLQRKGRKASEIFRALGNIERYLNLDDNSARTPISYSNQGRILCEVHILRHSSKILPRSFREDWFRDLSDVENMQLGVECQLRTVERIWRVYARFFV